MKQHLTPGEMDDVVSDPYPHDMPPAVAEWLALTDEERRILGSEVRSRRARLERPTTLDVEEWVPAMARVEVAADGSEWYVVLTAHDRTEVRVPSEILRAIGEHLDAMEPPACEEPMGCVNLADPNRPDDQRCTYHARTGRWGR